MSAASPLHSTWSRSTGPRNNSPVWAAQLWALALLLATSSLLGCTAGKPVQSPAPWTDLFDGTTLRGWQPTNFGGEGEVLVHDGALHMDFGSPMTGVTLTAAAPTGEYELQIKAARIEGTDFFCALTFPVGDCHLTLVLGGWGGSVCGLSNLEHLDAASNATRTLKGFSSNRDYVANVRVTKDAVSVTLDGQAFLQTSRHGQRLSLRPEMMLCRPLGIAAFATRARIRCVRWRPLTDH